VPARDKNTNIKIEVKYMTGVSKITSIPTTTLSRKLKISPEVTHYIIEKII